MSGPVSVSVPVSVSMSEPEVEPEGFPEQGFVLVQAKDPAALTQQFFRCT